VETLGAERVSDSYMTGGQLAYKVDVYSSQNNAICLGRERGAHCNTVGNALLLPRRLMFFPRGWREKVGEYIFRRFKRLVSKDSESSTEPYGRHCGLHGVFSQERRKVEGARRTKGVKARQWSTSWCVALEGISFGKLACPELIFQVRVT
jgi:hypothetical protein